VSKKKKSDNALTPEQYRLIYKSIGNDLSAVREWFHGGYEELNICYQERAEMLEVPIQVVMVMGDWLRDMSNLCLPVYAGCEKEKHLI
jgi:hypothetical protein